MNKIPLYRGSSVVLSVLKTVISFACTLAITITLCGTLRDISRSSTIRDRMMLDAFMVSGAVTGAEYVVTDDTRVTDSGVNNTQTTDGESKKSESPYVTEQSIKNGRPISESGTSENVGDITDSSDNPSDIHTEYKGIVSRTLGKSSLKPQNVISQKFDLSLPVTAVFYSSSPNESFYSVDKTLFSEEKNVSALARQMANQLCASGINAVYSNKGYSESLKLFPGASIFIDVRRELLASEDKRLVRGYTYIDSSPSAQILFSSSESTLPFTAYAISEGLSEYSEELSRGIILKSSEQASDEHSCFTIYIGTAANTLDEAFTAARFAVYSIASYILGQNISLP